MFQHLCTHALATTAAKQTLEETELLRRLLVTGMSVCGRGRGLRPAESIGIGALLFWRGGGECTAILRLGASAALGTFPALLSELGGCRRSDGVPAACLAVVTSQWGSSGGGIVGAGLLGGVWEVCVGVGAAWRGRCCLVVGALEPADIDAGDVVFAESLVRSGPGVHNEVRGAERRALVCGGIKWGSKVGECKRISTLC